GVEVMETTRFCGTTCHTVMEPEFTTHGRSAHAQVRCAACHVGPGGRWFVRSKMSGTRQVLDLALNRYPRPIPAPVRTLRPAMQTCGECHRADRFVGDRLKVITHHADDESSTPLKTVLVLHVGGPRSGRFEGIHRHADPALRIRYLADPARAVVSKIEVT